MWKWTHLFSKICSPFLTTSFRTRSKEWLCRPLLLFCRQCTQILRNYVMQGPDKNYCDCINRIKMSSYYLAEFWIIVLAVRDFFKDMLAGSADFLSKMYRYLISKLRIDQPYFALFIFVIEICKFWGIYLESRYFRIYYEDVPFPTSPYLGLIYYAWKIGALNGQ